MAQDSYFDTPQQLRELTERSVAHARVAYSQFMDATAQTTNIWLSVMPYNEMTSSIKVILERAVRFSKQNVEASFSLASELANAKDIQDVLGIQGRYAQIQMRTYALQAQELGNLMAAASLSMQPRR